MHLLFSILQLETVAVAFVYKCIEPNFDEQLIKEQLLMFTSEFPPILIGALILKEISLKVKLLNERTIPFSVISNKELVEVELIITPS
ncbi:hypothetical protein MBORA_11290 [Methanobrevibacter oralis]|uniref:Uncharacterized protein n=1 Tax=Methanobrevibacter oralis TaxID=66851 RepID=A0A166AVD6_METOA|nr:hypothetical protein MBORA_11290 [Methanobrevibacter oralis]